MESGTYGLFHGINRSTWSERLSKTTKIFHTKLPTSKQIIEPGTQLLQNMSAALLC